MLFLELPKCILCRKSGQVVIIIFYLWSSNHLILLCWLLVVTAFYSYGVTHRIPNPPWLIITNLDKYWQLLFVPPVFNSTIHWKLYVRDCSIKYHQKSDLYMWKCDKRDKNTKFWSEIRAILNQDGYSFHVYTYRNDLFSINVLKNCHKLVWEYSRMEVSS